MKKLLIAGLLLMGVTSCSVDNAIPDIDNADGFNTLDLVSSEGNVACGADVTWPFGSFDVGKVVVSQDGDNLYVEITANTETVTQRKLVRSRVSFYELNDPDFPNATEVGHIENPLTHENGTTTYTYSFPLEDLPECGDFFVVVWAVFSAGGPEAEHFAGNYIGVHGKWRYFKYCVKPCGNDDPPTEVCETAFMATSSNFTLSKKYGEKNAKNWGWYLYYNTATMSGDYPYDIYAAAGLNLIEKGEKVGTVTVHQNGTYDIQMQSGYFITNLHVYLNTSLPLKRQAPGLYRECGAAKDVIDNSCITGSFYLIIHMDVCWNVIAG